MEQYRALLDALLATPSGGLLPVLVSVAALTAIAKTYDLPWKIEWQGINVADAVKEAGSDITVFRGGKAVISIEVTGRVIDKARIRSTFATKISPNGIDDYLFFYAAAKPTDEARESARAYFAAGHEINFVSIGEWIPMILTVLGTKGRAIFTQSVIGLLGQKDVPAALKVAWNNCVRVIVP